MAKSRWEEPSGRPRGGTYINLAGSGCLRRNSSSTKGLQHRYSLPTCGTTWQAVDRTGGPCPARRRSYLRLNRSCAWAWNTAVPPRSAAARPGGAKRPGARVQARGHSSPRRKALPTVARNPRGWDAGSSKRPQASAPLAPTCSWGCVCRGRTPGPCCRWIPPKWRNQCQPPNLWRETMPLRLCFGPGRKEPFSGGWSGQSVAGAGPAL
jgi:hypothetical protein